MPNTTNNAITFPFAQGYFVPAQDRAMKSAVSDGMNRQLLIRSSSLIFWPIVRLSSRRITGSEKRKKMAVRDRAQMGRLIL